METTDNLPVFHIPRMAHNVWTTTLSQNGATFDIHTGSQLIATKGYGVSAYPERSVVKEDFYGLQETIEAFLMHNFDLLVKPNHYLGTWLDGKTGLFHIDVTMWIMDYDEAMQIARDKQQLAIWDCATGKEIYL